MAKKETTVNIIPDEVIVNKIYFLRKEKVMLDRDLAVLYDIKGIRLREQVKRNIERFPKHFMFQLSEEEIELMVSQNAIPTKGYLGGALPYAFTEHGILMLSNVLKSDRAIQVSIKIVELFVKLRETTMSYQDLKQEIDSVKRKMEQQGQDISIIFRHFEQLLKKKEEAPPGNRLVIGLPGRNETNNWALDDIKYRGPYWLKYVKTTP